MPNPVKCTRLYADGEGESHFEDIEFDMASMQLAPPAPALDVSDPIDTTNVSWMRFPEGWHDAAHLPPADSCSLWWQERSKCRRAPDKPESSSLVISCWGKTSLEKDTGPALSTAKFWLL